MSRYYSEESSSQKDQTTQSNIPSYLNKAGGFNKNKSKKNEIKQNKKLHKEHKEQKETKDSTKVKAKSQHGAFIKNQEEDLNGNNLKQTKEESNQQNVLKLDIKEELSYLEFSKNTIILEDKLAKIYVQNKGDIQKMAFMLKMPKLQILCKKMLPIIKNALKTVESIIKKRKLRRVFLSWNDIQLNEFIHKFFEIKNGELYGYSKKIDLATYWKLIEMKYDETVTINNEQALDFYKSCLDVHLSVYEDIENRAADIDKYLGWTRAEFKVLCRCLLKTDNLEKVSDVMIIEFGRLKEKFAPRKIFDKIDTLIKMSISKIKHQSSTYPGLGEIRKMMKHDFYNINYNQEPRYDAIRKKLIRYFERDTPPLQDTYDVLCKLNKFLSEERIYERRQVSQFYARQNLEGIQVGKDIRGSQVGEVDGNYDEGNQNQDYRGTQTDEIKREANQNTSRQIFSSQNKEKRIIQESRQNLTQKKAVQKQIHPQLKNLLEMDLEISSSDSEQQPNLIKQQS